MTSVTVDGAVLHARDEGPRAAPAIIFSNSLGGSLEMWDPQVAALSDQFRIIRYDNRGHGRSSVPDGPISLEQLAQDALAVLDHFELAQAHWCGLSMGGMIGQELAARAPGRFGKVVLSNTTSFYADPSFWHARIDAVRASGIAQIADAVIAGWLTEDFRMRSPDVTRWLRTMLLSTPARGYIATCEALARLDTRAFLPRITRPTHVIAGRLDKSTPPSAAEAIVAAIPGARLSLLDAAHISNVEQPEAFTAILRDVLS